MLHKCTDDTEGQINLVKEELGLDIIVHKILSDGPVQMGAYKKAMELYGQYTEWMLFLDCDEYVYSPKPSSTPKQDIKDCLNAFPNASAIACHGKVFGSNGNVVQPENRLTAYTERLPVTHISSHAVKTFIRTSKFEQVKTPHCQQVTGQMIRFDGSPFTLIDGWRTKELPIWEPICYNHYYTGSMEDWVARHERGSCNDNRPSSAYSEEEYVQHIGNTESDYDILQYLPEVNDSTTSNTLVLSGDESFEQALKSLKTSKKKYAFVLNDKELDNNLLYRFNQIYDGGVLFDYIDCSSVNEWMSWHIRSVNGTSKVANANRYCGLTTDVIGFLEQTLDVKRQIQSKQYTSYCVKLFSVSNETSPVEINNQWVLNIMQCEVNPLIKLDKSNIVFRDKDICKVNNTPKTNKNNTKDMLTHADYAHNILQDVFTLYDMKELQYMCDFEFCNVLKKFSGVVPDSLVLNTLVNHYPNRVAAFVKGLTPQPGNKPVKNIVACISQIVNGGAESFTRTFKDRLTKTGYNVKIATQIPHDYADMCLPYMYSWEKTQYMSAHQYNLTLRKYQLSEAIKKHDLDTFVLMSHWLKEAHWDILILKELGMNVIWMEHNNFLWSLYHQCYDMWQYKRWFMRLADFAVVLSPYDQCLFRKHGVDNAVFIPNLRTFEQIKRKHIDDPVLLVSTRFNPIKNITGILQVLSSVKRVIPNVLLKIAGTLENDPYIEKVRQYIAKLDLDNNVEICGYIEDIRCACVP